MALGGAVPRRLSKHPSGLLSTQRCSEWSFLYMQDHVSRECRIPRTGVVLNCSRLFSFPAFLAYFFPSWLDCFTSFARRPPHTHARSYSSSFPSTLPRVDPSTAYFVSSTQHVRSSIGGTHTHARTHATDSWNRDPPGGAVLSCRHPSRPQSLPESRSQRLLAFLFSFVYSLFAFSPNTTREFPV